MAVSEISFFTDRLAQKERELNEVQSAFNKYKLKHKCKLDQIKKDVYAYCSQNGIPINDKENCALLNIQLAETELLLENSRREAESLDIELGRRQAILNDHVILIKNLEEQVTARSPLRESELEERKQFNKHVDMERIQQQMTYKDERIIELNNVILDKERQILDLQEMCREQGEVANVKSQAMRIVQKKFEEMETRGRREVGTETDASLWHRGRERETVPKQTARSSSPGHAVASRVGTGASSPPPLDPSEAEERNAGNRDDEDDMSGCSQTFKGKNLDNESSLRKKNRKKVTFDLPPSASSSTGNVSREDHELTESLNLELVRLSVENQDLRQELEEKGRLLSSAEQRLSETDSNMAKVVKDSKNASLKARAVAQGRIRELEDKMAQINNQQAHEFDRLQTEIETLRSTREWEIEQNGQLREQMTQLRAKTHKLAEELDASEQSNRALDAKVIETQSLLDQLVEELSEAESIVVLMEDQKHSILDDVDRLKNALLAQDELIELLEADIVIYEEHIGILRESLGASKVDHRSLIRSKAFETKLKALEQEKEQIDRKSNEDRLRTKALSQKVKILEEENEKLMEKLCEKEMGAQDEADMEETCRQLEIRLREADERMQQERAELQLQSETARMEAERKAQEAALLLRELQETRLVLSQQQQEQSHAGTSMEQHNMHNQQTVLVDQEPKAAVDNQLREQLSEKCQEAERLNDMVRILNEQIDGLQGHNFELQEELQELRQTEQDFDNLVERHRTTSVSVVTLGEENEQLKLEIAQLSVELDNLRESTADLYVQKSQHEMDAVALRTELEHARVNLSETNAVKVELEQLRGELEQERANGQAKWDDVCRKMLEADGSLPGSRKSSMEVQNQQYIIAFEEKIEKLEEELAEAREKIEHDKTEKRKLKAAVKQLRDRPAASNVAEVGEPLVVRREVQKEEHPVEVEKEAVQKTSEEGGEEEENSTDVPTLQKRIKDLELECLLSVELNVEMGRAMQELELRLEKSEMTHAGSSAENDHSLMELRLHEMLEEEMGRELDEAKRNNVELERKMALLEEDVGSKIVQIAKLETELQQSREKNVGEEIDTLVVEELREKILQLTDGLQSSHSALHTFREEAENERRRIREAHDSELARVSGEIEDRWLSQWEEKQAEVDSTFAIYEENIKYLQAQLAQIAGNNGETEGIQETATSECTPKDQTIETSSQAVVQSAEPAGTASGEANTVSQSEETPVIRATPDLFAENLILRQCVNESVQMQDDMTQDVSKLLELKTELETAVDALKGEIWTLNGQLKASVIDRENLEDRVATLDSSLTAEKRRADLLDSDLAEQVELTEKATRQAAEAENQSNRRLAECLEMETRREELEKSYVQLTDYYNQLQAAYNVLYAKVNAPELEQAENVQATNSSPATGEVCDSTAVAIVDSILEELHIEIEGEADLTTKLSLIHETMKKRLAEIEESRRAICEQRRLNESLAGRLDELEGEMERAGREGLSARDELTLIRGDLEWKEEECNSMRRQMEELQNALDALIVRNEESDAAKLATRQADVDSLFRTNAELAHTNVRLQNELDEREQEAREQQEAKKDEEAALETSLETGEESSNKRDEKQMSTREHLRINARVEAVEEVLNKRIYGLEDELLEKEERVQELEEELAETKQELATVQRDTEGVMTEARERVQELEAVVSDLEKRISEMTLMEQSREAEHEQAISSLRADLEKAQLELSVLQESQLAAMSLPSNGQEKETEDRKEEKEREKKEGGETEEASWGWGDDEDEKKETGEEEGCDDMEALKLLFENSRAENEELRKQVELLEAVYMDAEQSAEDEIKEISNELVDELRKELERVVGEKDELERRLEERTGENVTSAKEDPAPAETAKNDEWGWGEESEGVVGSEEKREVEDQLEENGPAPQNEEWGWGEEEAEIASVPEEKDNLADELEKTSKEVEELREVTGNQRERVVQLEGEVREATEREQELRQLEGQLREEIELLTSKLNASPSKEQVSELQLKISSLESELEESAAALHRLRCETDEKTEAWGWEEESFQNQTDTNNEDLVRVREQLESSESEVSRLTEELLSCTQKKDELAAELSAFRDRETQATREREEEMEQLEELRLELEKQNEDLSLRLSRAETALSSLEKEKARVLQEKLELERQQTSHLELEELQKKCQLLSEELSAAKSELAEVERQNDLLKESEARLLDSVDEYGEVADRQGEEARRLQTVVNKLEAERLDIDELQQELRAKNEELVAVRAELEELRRVEVNPTKSAECNKDEELASKLVEIEQERDSLRSRLSEMQTLLDKVDQEKRSLKSMYDQLRARVRTRQSATQPAASSNDVSRASSSQAMSEVSEVPREPTPPVSVVLPVEAVTARNLILERYQEQVTLLLSDLERFLSLNVQDTDTQESGEIMGKRKGSRRPTTGTSQAVAACEAKKETECESPPESVPNPEVMVNLDAVEEKSVANLAMIEKLREELILNEEKLLNLQAEHEKEIDVLKLKCDELTAELSEKEKSLEQVAVKESEITDLKQLVDKLQQELIDSQKEREVMQSERMQLEKELETERNLQVEKLSALQASSDSSKEALLQEINGLKSQLALAMEESERAVGCLKEENSTLASNEKELQSKLDESVRELAEAKTNFASIEESLQQDLVASQNAVEVWRQKVAEEEQRVEAKYKNILEEAVGQAAELRSHFEDSIAKLLEAHNEAKAALEDECGLLKSELDFVRDKNESMEEFMDKLQDQRKEAELETGRALLSLSEVEEKLRSCEKERDEAISEKNAISLEKTSFQSELERTKEKLQDTVGLMDVLQQAEEELQAKVLQLEVALREQEQLVTKEELKKTSALEAVRHDEIVGQLREDNLRLEKELVKVQNTLEFAEVEMEELRKQAVLSDEAARKSRSEAQRLLAELERSRFDLEQLVNSNEGRDAANRVRELEETVSQLRTQHAENREELMEDLRTCELRLKLADERGQTLAQQNEELSTKVDSWRSKFELASREVETLNRSIGEVAQLEAVIKQAHAENNELLAKLSTSSERITALSQENQSISQQLEVVTQQLNERTLRLQQVGEQRTDSTIRFVAMESQLADMTRQRDELLQNSQSAAGLETSNEEVKLSIDEPATITIGGEEETVNENDEQDTSWHDFDVGSSTLLRASAPTLTSWEGLWRRMRVIRRRPGLAILPIVRLGLALYFVFLHFIAFRCILF